MEESMRATSKIIWTLILVCILLLILVTGQSNVRNFEKVQSSIETIYKDRLVVKGLIFELSSLLHQKEIAIISGNQTLYKEINESINAEIEKHLQSFRATQLTIYEEKTLDRFTKALQTLQARESALGLADGFDITEVNDKMLSAQFNGLQKDLKTLSEIQLSEGKRKLGISDKAVDSMNVFARFENYILIIFGVLILVLIFIVPGASAKESAKPKED